MEEERRALANFVTRIDSLGLSSIPPSKLRPPMPTPGGSMTAYERRQARASSSGRLPRISDATVTEEFTGIGVDFTGASESSPVRLDRGSASTQPSLMDQAMLEEMGSVDISFDELEVEQQLLEMSMYIQPGSAAATKLFGQDKGLIKDRGVLSAKENIFP
jgi:centromeric protein E